MTHIEVFRKRKGLTQLQLAQMVGYTTNTIWRWENGQRTPNAEALKALADVLECSIDELVRDDPSNPTAPAEDTPSKGL